jgi:ribosomal protein S18 acetylase RimI-like enzyme
VQGRATGLSSIPLLDLITSGVMEGPVVVELVEAQVVRPLRRAVLRPGRADEESAYPADDDPDTAHVATRIPAPVGTKGPVAEVADVLAVGTVLREAPPWEPQQTDGWRVRGMATLPDARRRGLGGCVLDALLDHVAAHGGGLVWCNARVAAQALYARAGFAARGPVFELPDIGPHRLMWRTVVPGPHRTLPS